MSDETSDRSGGEGPSSTSTGNMMLMAMEGLERKTLEKLEAISADVSSVKIVVDKMGIIINGEVTAVDDKPGLVRRVKSAEDKLALLVEEDRQILARVKGQGVELVEVKTSLAGIQKTLDDDEKWRRQIKMWVVGGVIAIVTSTVMGLLGLGLMTKLGG